MKYQFLILVCLMVAMFSGCQKETTLEVRQDGAAVSLSIPADASAADLINMQTALSNSLTIKAKREEQLFALKQAELRKSERQFYGLLIVGGIVSGILGVFTISALVIVWRVSK